MPRELTETQLLMRAMAYSFHEFAHLREGKVAEVCNSIVPEQSEQDTTKMFGVNSVSGRDVRDWTRYYQHGKAD